ncbi:hypothetical protein ACRAWF_32980 [Streptomyces sp. L7]
MCALSTTRSRPWPPPEPTRWPAALAVSGVCELFEALPAYAADPGSLAVLERCQLAAWKSYTAPGIAASGISHQLGRAVGAANGIPQWGDLVRDPAPGRSGTIESFYPTCPPVSTTCARALGLAGELGRAGPRRSARTTCPRASASRHGSSAAELGDDALEQAAGRAAEQSGLPRELMREILSRCRTESGRSDFREPGPHTRRAGPSWPTGSPTPGAGETTTRSAPSPSSPIGTRWPRRVSS